MRSKAVRGVVIRTPASRATSNFNTCFPLWGEWRATASRERSVKFSDFSWLPLGGRLLAKQGGEGRRYPHPGKQSGERMRTDSGLFQFSVFSRLPLGGRLLAKQGGEGRRYPHPGKQSGERMRTDSGLFQFSVFSRLPLGGRLLAKQGGEGCRYPHPGKQSGEQLQHLLSPLGRVASNREPIAVFKTYPPCMSAKIQFFKPFKMQKKYLQ